MDTTINVGDRVRSFDFEGRDLTGPRAAYAEGVVEAIVTKEGCPRYAIRVDKWIVGGEDTTYAFHERGTWDGMIYPPVNGTLTLLGRTTNGVEKI